MLSQYLKIENLRQNRLLIAAVVFFIALILLFAVFIAIAFGFQKKYEGKVFPGLYAGSVKLSGLDRDGLYDLLNAKADEVNAQGIDFYHANDKETIYPVLAGAGGDIAIDLIRFDIDETVKNILNYGRRGSYFSNVKDIITAAIYGERIFLVINTDDARIKEILENRFTPLEARAKNAELIYLNDSFRLSKEESGKLVNYEAALKTLKNNLRRLNFSSIGLEIGKTDYPEISLAEAESSDVSSQAEKLLAQAPLILSYKENQWKIEKSELADWLTLKNKYSYCETHVGECDNDNKVKAGFDPVKAKEYFEKNISAKIDIPAQTAKFKMEGGKVNVFQAGRDGIRVNIEESLAKAEYELAAKNNTKVELAVEATQAEIEESDVNDLGIKEILGTGQSNFVGSPKNRRHNIANGASFVNGTLIKPGEEFSLLKTLGAIDKSTGYLTELVIKGNKTIPEYGGGLCQIGTTVFRGAVASGLPITARSNHSYRVQYYEPAGTDATIYDPAPDFKFLNDTGHHVLIQSRIEGNIIYFDYWGTKDGRQASSTYPTIYNIVKPAATKMIETTDLKPGVKKCTESAHNGADAYFDYKVTYPTGEVKEKRFTSHYRPWQAVCLIGVEKLTPAPAPTNPDGTAPGAKTPDGTVPADPNATPSTPDSTPNNSVPVIPETPATPTPAP